MLTRIRPAVTLLIIAFALLPTGCQQVDGQQFSLFTPLKTLLKRPTPVRIGVTRTHFNPLTPAPWEPLQEHLAESLGRDVQVLQLKPFQIRAKFRRGDLDFAIVSAVDHAKIGTESVCKSIAVATRPDGKTATKGLILVKANSDINALSELKGRRMAFGPAFDPVLHVAASATLINAGIVIEDLATELLPPYGLHTNSFEAGKALAFEGADAAVVDPYAFNQWPETGTRLLPPRLGRDSFRVLATTPPVPADPVLAGVHVDKFLVKRVEDFLIDHASRHEDICDGMEIGGFKAVPEGFYKGFSQTYATLKPQLPSPALIPGLPGLPGRSPTSPADAGSGATPTEK